MVKTKKTYKPRRKTTYRRRPYARKARITRTPNSGSLMPSRKHVKLVYESSALGTTTTTAINWHTFSLNSMYDPDVTGIGHQPLGFDQLANFYQRYRVHGCKVIVEGINYTPNTAACILFNLSDLPADRPADLREAKEQPRSKCRLASAETRTFRMQEYYPVSYISGRTKRQVNMEDNFVGTLSSASGTSPADQVYLQLGHVSLDEVTSVGVSMRLKMIFYATVFDLRVMPLS